jgi:ribosomal protein S27E
VVTGKSSLVNSIFGANIAQVGVGVPVTMHYTRIEPTDRPVVIYDSRGLEDGHHVEFLQETRAFFQELRSRPRIQEHIHVVWYVVNAACGRFEPFELQLVRDIFSPTPVIFVLNKTDLVSASQLHALTCQLRSYDIECCRGIVAVVAERRNYSQSWCPRCYSDDVMFSRATNTLVCDACQHAEVMVPHLGLSQLIETTSVLLPDLAKEAFLFAQVESLQERDRRAMELVKQYAANISMDVAGKSLTDIGEMVGRIFILWGWNFLGFKVSSCLMHEMREEYKNQELGVRLAMIAADTILKRKLSRSVIACLGLLVNRPLRQLSEQLLVLIENTDRIDATQFQLPENAASEQLADRFMQVAFEHGYMRAIDTFWYTES